MLTLSSDTFVSDCTGISRRDFLSVGSLGMGGLTLANLLATQATAVKSGNPMKDKSVVLLFLRGGPPQFETFDPKMNAPVEYRSMFGEVASSLPGVSFGSHFPQMAKQAQQMAIIRSFAHGNSNHPRAQALVSSGGNPTEASMGAMYGRLAGLTNPRTGLPTSTFISPASLGEKYRKFFGNRGNIAQAGSLGKAYEPFDPSRGGEVMKDMELSIPQNRLDDRRLLLSQLDDMRRQIDANEQFANIDKFNQQAYDVILGGAADAFDISKEDPRTIAMYDTSDHKIPSAVRRKKRKKNVERSSPVTLGKQMLMARRLCERGSGFVTVSSAGWDMHGIAFGVDDGMPVLGPAVDQAVSAFLKDVEQRGLSEKILLVITGEFGRTPRINSKAGRNHWGNLCPLIMAGGGLNMGQVIGHSDNRGYAPVTEPIGPADVMATIMHTLFDVGQLRTVRGVPRDILTGISNGTPIEQLF